VSPPPFAPVSSPASRHRVNPRAAFLDGYRASADDLCLIAGCSKKITNNDLEPDAERALLVKRFTQRSQASASASHYDDDDAEEVDD
jgi:hypothetical protein